VTVSVPSSVRAKKFGLFSPCFSAENLPAESRGGDLFPLGRQPCVQTYFLFVLVCVNVI